MYQKVSLSRSLNDWYLFSSLHALPFVKEVDRGNGRTTPSRIRRAVFDHVIFSSLQALPFVKQVDRDSALNGRRTLTMLPTSFDLYAFSSTLSSH
jgi:hypothetical protein